MYCRGIISFECEFGEDDSEVKIEGRMVFIFEIGCIIFVLVFVVLFEMGNCKCILFWCFKFLNIFLVIIKFFLFVV